MTRRCVERACMLLTSSKFGMLTNHEHGFFYSAENILFSGRFHMCMTKDVFFKYVDLFTGI